MEDHLGSTGLCLAGGSPREMADWDRLDSVQSDLPPWHYYGHHYRVVHWPSHTTVCDPSSGQSDVRGYSSSLWDNGHKIWDSKSFHRFRMTFLHRIRCNVRRASNDESEKDDSHLGDIQSRLSVGIERERENSSEGALTNVNRGGSTESIPHSPHVDLNTTLRLIGDLSFSTLTFFSKLTTITSQQIYLFTLIRYRLPLWWYCNAGTTFRSETRHKSITLWSWHKPADNSHTSAADCSECFFVFSRYGVQYRLPEMISTEWNCFSTG